MRELTQQEIDDKPEWANSTFINSKGLITWFNNESGKAKVIEWGVDAVILSRVHYAFSHNKPIPRKDFDISPHEWSDPTIVLIGADDDCIELMCSISHDVFDISRDDFIAGAKHFKLTRGDLK